MPWHSRSIPVYGDNQYMSDCKLIEKSFKYKKNENNITNTMIQWAMTWSYDFFKFIANNLHVLCR